MDYCAIGQKIRKYRKARNLSQEILAEKVGISTTHLSHIETGNTKLSLPVLVQIAIALDVHTDDLLFDQPSNRNVAMDDLSEVLDSCTTQQIKIIVDTVKALKISLDTHDEV